MGTAYKVIDGPGHHGLFASLSEGNESQRKIIVFCMTPEAGGGQAAPVNCRAIVNTVGREDGSGCSWNIICDALGESDRRKGTLNGWFNTKSRKGHLVLALE